MHILASEGSLSEPMTAGAAAIQGKVLVVETGEKFVSKTGVLGGGGHRRIFLKTVG